MDDELCKKVKRKKDDCISNLPEEIIYYILSFLPIEESVQTSVLSRNWKDKWTFTSDIKLNDKCLKSLPGEDRAKIFEGVVEKILFLTSDLRSFHISCDEIQPFSYLGTWVSQALRRNVRSLKIEVCTVSVSDSTDVSLLFFERSTSLTELKLAMSRCILTLPPQNSGFFNLKRLYLIGKSRNGPFIIKCLKSQELLNFPVLEVLELKFCKWLIAKIVEIQAPNLITFTACLLAEMSSIKICGAKLATYEPSCGFIGNFNLYAPAVTSVTLYHIPTRGTPVQVYMASKQIPDLKFLRLSGHTFQAIVQAKLGHIPSIFNKLKQLDLYSNCSMEDLFTFLRGVPCLESLTLNVQRWHSYNYEQQGEANLPPCISYCLKEIKFLRFKYNTGHVNLAKFMLRSAENLQSMHISIRGLREGMINCLSSTLLPKSPTCVVKIEG